MTRRMRSHRLPSLAPVVALVAFAALLAMTAPPASAEWYEGKPECPPDEVCTLAGGAGDGTQGSGPSQGKGLSVPAAGALALVGVAGAAGMLALVMRRRRA